MLLWEGLSCCGVGPAPSVEVCGFLFAVASFAAQHRLWSTGVIAVVHGLAAAPLGLAAL